MTSQQHRRLERTNTEFCGIRTCATILRELPDDRRETRRTAGRLDDRRGRRRQSQPRVHRQGRRTAASPSSRRCPMCGWSARAGRCRCRARITSTGARAAGAVAPDLCPASPSRRTLALTAMELPRAAHHPAQGHDPRHRAIRASPTTSRPSWPRPCSSPPISRCRPREKKETSARSRQYRAVQDHRGPDLHRSLPHGGAQPLDPPGSTSTAAAVRADVAWKRISGSS